ncbi:pilin [Patescibacteria group bacterium]|nr:pilin [Patescibacteria group bacterium]
MNTYLLLHRQQLKCTCIAAMIALSTTLFIPLANSATDTVRSGLGDADLITGIEGVGEDSSIKDFIVDVITDLLTYVALLATIVIIIGGIYLIAGAGSDTSIEKAKKIIIYTIVGLLVIILAGAIVQFVINTGEGGETLPPDPS